MATFSNDVKVTNFTYKSTEPMYSNQSWTGQRIMRSTGIQYAQIQFTLSFTKAAMPEIRNFLALYTQGAPFTISLGFAGQYYGNQTGALTSTKAVAKGQRVITTNTNKMAIGEMIQFTNHKKLYRIIDCTTTTLTLFPALMNTVQANEVIQYNNLIVQATLDPDNDYSYVIGNTMSLTLKAQEDVT